jgi:ATP-dependent RNA helicase DDX35
MFWKPGNEGPNCDRDAVKEETASTSGTFVFNPHINADIRRQKGLLSISRHRGSILEFVSKYQTLILTGETGCGKSTQVPQFLYESNLFGAVPKESSSDGPRGLIAVTQPRRIPTMMLAARVSEEMGTTVGYNRKESQEHGLHHEGGIVGCHVPYRKLIDPKHCRITFLTDEVLVRETRYDPLLSRYNVIMVDEAHERSLYTDILLGILRNIQGRRPSLRVIVSSATMDTVFFKSFFERNQFSLSKPDKDTAKIISLESLPPCVDCQYLRTPCSNYVEEAVRTVIKILVRNGNDAPGDNGVLIFMPGVDEVGLTLRVLRERILSSPGLPGTVTMLPLHGKLPNREQLRCFMKLGPGKRKIIVATNVAEASLTVPGIRYVVDSMFIRLPHFNSSTGLETNATIPVSKASAEQRLGRAGRTGSGGVCFRLCTKLSFDALKANTTPAVQRSDLTWVVLKMISIGVGEFGSFSFPSPPPAKSLARALELLFVLGALNDDCGLTHVGSQMAFFSCGPCSSKALLASLDMGCSEEILSVIALMSVHRIFLSPRNKSKQEEALSLIQEFADESGDHVTALKAYNAFTGHMGRSSAGWARINFCDFNALCRAKEIRSRLITELEKCKPTGVPFKSCGEDNTVKLLTCICAGYFSQVACLGHDGLYRTLKHSRPVLLHSSSVLERFPQSRVVQWVVYHDILLDDDPQNDCLRDVSVINPKWLLKVAPHYYKQGGSRKTGAVERSTAPAGGRSGRAGFWRAGFSSSSSATATRGMGLLRDLGTLPMGVGAVGRKRKAEDELLYPLILDPEDSDADESSRPKSKKRRKKEKKKKRKKEKKKQRD